LVRVKESRDGRELLAKVCRQRGILAELRIDMTSDHCPGLIVWQARKQHHHGGNVQVVTVPDGWPIWTSPVRPGREHDTTAVRAHTEILPALTEISDDLRTLGDLGYEGESETITVAFKKPKHGELTDIQQTFNKAHNGSGPPPSEATP
jgi:hypothetical protein